MTTPSGPSGSSEPEDRPGTAPADGPSQPRTDADPDVRTPPTGGWPIVSVVIAARNEAARIESAVRSALTQNYPGRLEVIVADGDSEDDTRRIVEDMRDPRITVVANPERLTASGLNRAIRAAGGTVIVRCDGHAVLPPSYVRTAVATLAATGAANVGGIQAATGTGLTSRAIAIAMTSRLGVGDGRVHLGGEAGPVDTVYLGVFDRSKIEDVGLFDERLVRNQDYELNYRLRRAGHTVWFTPDLAVTYHPRSSIRKLWLQYFDYGRWKRAMLASNPAAIRLRQLAPPLFVLGLLASAIALAAGAHALAAVVPVAYLVAVAGGTAWALIRRRDPAAVLLPLVLPTMHIAWGAGFLIGPPEH